MGLRKILKSDLVEVGTGILFKPDGDLHLSPQDFARIADIIEAEFGLSVKVYRKNQNGIEEPRVD